MGPVFISNNTAFSFLSIGKRLELLGTHFDALKANTRLDAASKMNVLRLESIFFLLAQKFSSCPELEVKIKTLERLEAGVLDLEFKAKLPLFSKRFP